MGRAVAHEAAERQVAGEGFASEAADDDLFVGGGHGASVGLGESGLANCRMPTGQAAKKCSQRSQIANAVLDLRFVPARHDLDKRLIRLRLDAVSGQI